VHKARAGALCAGAAALAGVATGIGLPSATGCTTTQCDPKPGSYGGGEMVDENTYETSPIEDPDAGPDSGELWISYQGNETLTVTFPDAAVAVIGHRKPEGIEAYVGTAPQPNDTPGANFTSISGGLVEFYDAGSGGFSVLNNTCSKYYARFVVHFPEVPSTGPDASE